LGNNIVVVLLVLVKICHIMAQRCFMLCTTYTNFWSIICPLEVRCLTPLSKIFQVLGEFTTTCAIVAYHHLSCEFEPHSWRGALDKTLCDKVCQWLATDLWIWLSLLINFLFISINENNWFAESMFFVGVHWMDLYLMWSSVNCNRCLSSLKLWVWTPFMARCTR
jgi:hypothetical protein